MMHTMMNTIRAKIYNPYNLPELRWVEGEIKFTYYGALVQRKGDYWVQVDRNKVHPDDEKLVDSLWQEYLSCLFS